MNKKSIQLTYIALILLLAITVYISFPYSMYLFATMKALLILLFFMRITTAEKASKLYMFIALSLLAVMVFGVLDDVTIRPFIHIH